MVFQKLLYVVEHALYILLKETAVSQQIYMFSKCAHPISYFFALIDTVEVVDVAFRSNIT